MGKGDHIQEGLYLSALHDGGTFSADYQSLYGKPDELPAMNYQDKLARFVARSFAAPTTGGELVSDLLRIYTDEWLGTGFDFDGKESPFARRLTQAKVAWAAVWDEEDRTLRGRGIDWDNGIERLPFSLARKLTIESDGEPVKPAALPFAPKRTQPPPNTPLPGTVEWALANGRARRKAKLRDQTPATRSHPNMPEDLIAAASLRANIIFHAFMKAPWRYRLAKCNRCQTYFVLKVNPSKTPYVRGMHCSECKSPASAEASAKTKRADREKQLLGLAASVWSSWRPDSRFGERNDWVATQVCKLLGEKKAIQKNWVTRHEKEIAVRAKKGAGAPISEAVESTGAANRETENLVSTIKRFRGAGSLSIRGKGTV